VSASSGEYQTEQRETLAEAPGLRVRLLHLAAGQCVPWHYHNHITDTFICLRGPMRVVTRDPDVEHVLQAGDTLAVGPCTPHSVTGVGAGHCKFVVIQGVGEYDYVEHEP
jgi:quercetin dioxygenase-like cupin family protein